MKFAIDVRNVSKVFDEHVAVKDMNLQIQEGMVVSLLGPNGAGKTTTLSMILGLIKPTSGTIQLFGSSPQNQEIKDCLGVLMQDNALMDGLKVKEVINLYRSYYRNPLSLGKLLAFSGLEDKANKWVTALSGGQKRRLGFAQALAGNPTLLFLDEPTVGMDVQSKRVFWETVKDFVKEGKTVVLTTHYLEEADAVSDRIVVMNKGRIIADGSPTSLKENATSSYVSFQAGVGVKPQLLQSLPAVERVEWKENKVTIFSKNTDRLLFELFKNNVDIYDIEVQKGKLEDAFEFLTNKDKQKIS